MPSKIMIEMRIAVMAKAEHKDWANRLAQANSLRHTPNCQRSNNEKAQRSVRMFAILPYFATR
jgi:hypothetical protein